MKTTGAMAPGDYAITWFRNAAKLCHAGVIPIGIANPFKTKMRGSAHTVDEWIRRSENMS